MGNDGFYLDLFENFRVIQQPHRGFHRDVSLFPSETLLAFGTRDDAKTVWMDHAIGSLEPGKKADLIIVDLKTPGTLLKRNVLGMLVNFGYGTKVAMTMVNGVITVKDQQLILADETKIRENMRATTEGIWDRGQQTPLPEYQIYESGKINQSTKTK